jgi:5-enolpyruvylshikimate-3-phosphate synthase
MAMAAALASLHCPQAIEIQNAECVYKSYPRFWSELQAQPGFLNFC